MKIIDTHIHLDLKQFNRNLDEVILRARENGIDKFIIPGIESHRMEKLIHICETNDDIYFASGNHPNYKDSFDLDLIRKYAAHDKCVAIGECGLDWFRIPKGSTVATVKREQIDIFRQQIELSIEFNKPLILHSRDTDDDMVNTLLEYKNELPGGVIHCYVGSEKLLQLMDHGFYFGIGGIVTYRSAIDLRENIKNIPLDRLLLETDGPYLTPTQAKNKSKINEPSFIPYILKDMSKILNVPEDELSKICYQNTLDLFKF